MDSKSIIETRQRADEMIRQAMIIWQNSDYADDLEGLDKDPVFRMLMTALASEFRGMESEMENLKQQVKDEFAEMFIPYEADNVVPTALLVETQPAEGVADMVLDGGSSFVERTEGYRFMPLLRTRVLNASVEKVVRMDGRRWRVTLAFPEGVTKLDWFTFAMEGLVFRDIKVSCGTRELSIIKPWDFHDFPYNEAFDFAVRLVNQSPVMNSLSLCMEMLAKRDVSIFCLDEQEGLAFAEETKSLDFVFEFFGIDDNFVLEKSKLHLNAVPLLNVQVNSVTLTTESPMIRLADDRNHRFLKLLPPTEDQVFNRYNVNVRKVMSDRFNLASLVRLLDCLQSKFHTDYYAFQMMHKQDGDALLRNMTAMIQKLREMAISAGANITDGIYLILKDESGRARRMQGSCDVRYLTTDNNLSEETLTQSAMLSVPVGLEGSRTRQVVEPMVGTESNAANGDRGARAAYYVATSDRLVTPADMRMFCTYMLTESFSLNREMIRHIAVVRQRSEHSAVGYEIRVDITLADSNVVRKAVGDRLPRIESIIEKMITSRSLNIYPVRLSIVLK